MYFSLLFLILVSGISDAQIFLDNSSMGKKFE